MLKIIFKLAGIVLVFGVFGVFGFVVLAIPLVLGYATRGVEWLHGPLERLTKRLDAWTEEMIAHKDEPDEPDEPDERT